MMYEPYGSFTVDFPFGMPAKSASVVESCFTSLEGGGWTRVSLRQSRWGRFGKVAAMVFDGYSKGWGVIFDGACRAACSAAGRGSRGRRMSLSRRCARGASPALTVAAGLLLGVGVGCGGAPKAGPELAPPLGVDLAEVRSGAVAEVAEVEEVEERGPWAAELRSYAVYHDDYARDRFYSWTTAEQVEALRGGGPLLVATATSGGRPTPYTRALEELAEGGSSGAELARALREDPALSRHRYAWVSGFATVMGLGPRGYGDELIAIDLDPQAWIVKLEPAKDEPLSVIDLAGRPVELARAVAEPARIGAVYHVRDHEPIPYREYVICNPAMVTGWSLRTPALAAELARERRLVEELADDPFAWLPELALREPSTPVWASRPVGVDLVGLWRASLAFDNERYRPSVINLRELGDALAGAAVGGAPLVSSPGP